jgi:hypothetical protein
MEFNPLNKTKSAGSGSQQTLPGPSQPFKPSSDNFPSFGEEKKQNDAVVNSMQQYLSLSTPIVVASDNPFLS